jgi:hypothetical protein
MHTRKPSKRAARRRRRFPVPSFVQWRTIRYTFNPRDSFATQWMRAMRARGINQKDAERWLREHQEKGTP